MKAVALAAALVVLATLPLWVGSTYYVNVACQILFYAVFALAVNVLAGYAGLVSLGHAGLFGIAAYTAGKMLTAGHAHLGAVMAGIAATLVASAMFAVLALRGTGLGFVMITVALGQIVWGVAYRWISITNGDNGVTISGRPAPFGLSLATPRAFYWATLVVFLLAVGSMALFVASPFGASVRGTRDQPRRMNALGYHVWMIRFLAFLVSGFWSGVAGLLFLYYNQFVSPQAVALTASAEALLMVISGGTATLAGPIVGAALVVVMKNVASAYIERWNLVLGGIFVLIVVFMPEGLVPGTARLIRWVIQYARPTTKEAPMATLLLGLVLLLMAAAPVSAQVPPRGHGAEAQNMELVGHDDLQGRSAYQPTIHKQGARFIAYVGHHGGKARNPLTGADEDNGTSIVDVTDPSRPKYLAHIPGAVGGPEQGGAQMARVCDRGGKTYLLRTFGNNVPNSGHEVWDVTDPAKPQKASTVVSKLSSTHKNWWECDTGTAYLVSGDLASANPLQPGPSGWRTGRMAKIYDLSDPTKPVFVRDFGLATQEPGSTGPVMIAQGMHGPIVVGNRVYFAYGTSGDGLLQIVDRDRLLTGPKEPTAANLNAPEVSRLWTSPNWGGHTAFPILRVPITDWAPNTKERTRDFVFLVSEAIANECREARHASFVIDITAETRPFGVATYQVPEGSRGFCRRGGRFGPHSSSESFAPVFYRKVVFVAYFNAGVRAVDIRDPYAPREAGFYIPATTERTAERCVQNGTRSCKVAIQTNNVENDERGLVYLADRANTGLHIVRLTGDAAKIAGGK